MKSRANVVGLLVAPLATLGACNALLGVEDVHLRDNPSGAAANGGDGERGGTSSGGTSSNGGSDAPEAGGPSSGGVPGGGGEPAPGGGGEPAPGGAGEPTGGIGGSEAGAGGMGGAEPEPEQCPVRGEEKPVRGPLTLVQLAPLTEVRGHLNVSADGKNAYATSWGSTTQHFTRDPATGKLTAKSKALVYNGEFSQLSPDGQRLFVGGVNGLQFYSIPFAADGTIADTDITVPPSYKPAMDSLAIGDATVLLASQDSIRAIHNDEYDANNRLPGTYDGLRSLSRSGQYLYWTEYANDIQFPNGATKVGRARLECDGSLGPREAFSTGYGPFDVAACARTGLLYVPHVAESLPSKPGWVDVVDLSTCEADFASCAPVKKLTGTDIDGLLSPNGIRLSTDCSTLFLSDGANQGRLLVLSLADPKAPALLQTFESGKEYDGVKLTGRVWAWHTTFFDGYLYVSMEFGDGIAVFKPQK
jgi:hypothetical protein